MHHQPKLGGRLRQFLPFWRSICNDHRVLSLIKGAKFEFEDNYVQQEKRPRVLKMSECEQEFMNSKIAELLEDGSIREVQALDPHGWVSNVFLVPKKDGGYRMILNLKPLNKLIKYRKFKMDHIHQVLDLVTQNCVMTSLDIRSAFNHVAVHRAHQKFMCFEWDNKFYEFQCLAQGATCSPRYFVKITAPLMKYLRAQGVTIIIYIDDTILIGSSLSELERNMTLTIDVLEQAGFLINYQKSNLQPSTCIEFLGFVIDSVKFQVSLTKKKRDCIHKLVSQILDHPDKLITIRTLGRIIGKIVATFPCSESAPLHYRILDRFKVKQLRLHKNRWSAKIKISCQCLQELRWWRENVYTNQLLRSLHEINTTANVFSDACGASFGGHWGNRSIQSRFSDRQLNLSINTKELLAIFYTLSSFASELTGHHVLMHSDNTVAVSCLRKRGSSDPMRDTVTRKIFQLAQDHKFTIKSTWLSTKANWIADRLSRRILHNPRTEWSLDFTHLQTLLNTLSWCPDIDLFASHLNNKLPIYCSRARDPHSSWVDAFTLNWHDRKCYCFSPFSIIGKILNKIRQDRVEHMAMIVPFHPSSSWFPRFIQLAREPPLLLPRQFT